MKGEKFISTKIWSQNLNERDYVEDLDRGGMMMALREIWWKDVFCIHVALDRD
jgi:hypothetical protein